MSTISSKQGKSQGLLDPVSVLVVLVLILALLILEPLAGNAYNSIGGALGSPGNSAGTSASGDISFTTDQRYWDANCGHGWSTDATCETIVLRAQSCRISVASAYCSEYDAYLQQFRN